MVNFSTFGKDKGKHPLEKEKGNEMARDPKTDPTEELGCKLSPSERVARVFQEMKDSPENVRLSPRDLEFLKNNNNSTWPSFTVKQEKWMQDIEDRVFGEEPQRVEADEEDSAHRELDGQLRFKK